MNTNSAVSATQVIEAAKINAAIYQGTAAEMRGYRVIKAVPAQSGEAGKVDVKIQLNGCTAIRRNVRYSNIDIVSIATYEDEPDADWGLPCGCVVAMNHGEWDYDLSSQCWEHTFTESVALATKGF